MANVFAGQPFARKHVAEMSPAVVAKDLYPPSVFVAFPPNGTRYLVVEGGPAAMGIEFVGRAVKWGLASAADVGAIQVKLVVLAREGEFRAFALDHLCLLGRQVVPVFF